MQEKFKGWYESAQEKAGTQEGLLIKNTEEEHAQKWELITRLVREATDQFQSSPTSVLDVGCGYADLAKALKVGTSPYAYTGIECTEWIYKYTRVVSPELDIRFSTFEEYVRANLFKHDVVVAIGVMATLSPVEDSAFLTSLLNVTHRGLILSYQDANRYRGQFRRFHPEEIEEFFEDRGWKVKTVVPDFETENYVLITPNIP